MTDAYRIAEVSQVPQRSGAGGIARPLLWLLLVISVAANVVTKSMDITIFVSIGFGLVAVSCGVALAVDHHRRKRR